MQTIGDVAEPGPGNSRPDRLRQSLVAAFFGARASRPDLSLRELAILLVVQSARTPQSVTMLTARLGLARGVVRRGVEMLEREGYVTRPARPADRRTVSVQATPRGEQLLRLLATPVPPKPGRQRLAENVIPYIPAARGQAL